MTRKRFSRLRLVVALFATGCLGMLSPDARPAAAGDHDLADILLGWFVDAGLTVEQLVFPGLDLPLQTGEGRSVCTPRDSQRLPPQWLIEAVGLPVCSPELRRVLQAHASSSSPGEYGPQDRLTASAVCNDPAAMEAAIASGAKPNDTDSCGELALVAAAAAGSDDAVHKLLSAGAFPDHRGLRGRRALGAAVLRRDRGIAHALLDAGASADAGTPSGFRPLAMAAAADDEAMVRLLLEAGANPCMRDDAGMGPIGMAEAHGAMNVLPVLRKASKSCRDRDGAGT